MTAQAEPLAELGTHDALREALHGAVDRKEPVALALLDIDHFVGINTDLGHAAGDGVLRTAGAVLAEAAPGQAYRVSGDEFAILMPGASLEEAFLQAERVRAHFEASRSRFGLPNGREVSITAGVAQYPRDAKDAPSLLRAADAALMAAKEAGRNRVALPPNEEMVMKTCYYPVAMVRKLKALAERQGKKESALFREALDDLLRKHDVR